MSTFFSPFRPTARSCAFAPFAPAAHPQTQSVRAVGLSPRQLLDVELGLFLLAELLPQTTPDALPTLLIGTGSSLLDYPTWTPKQHKLLSRGRALLTHLTDRPTWTRLLDNYVTGSAHLQAYDISRDRSRFVPKTVGFSRNRLAVLRNLLG